MKKNKTLLLIGGGHAHMHFMKKYSQQKIDAFDVILISVDNKQYYSGMASAFLEGIYNKSDFSFDLPQICKVCGIEFILGNVEKIDSNKKTIILENGTQIPFDVVSINVGSDVFGKNIEGVNNFAATIKPLSNLINIKNSIKSSTSNNLTLMIVGAGAAGVEVGLAIKEYSRKLDKKIDISIISSGKQILKDYSIGIRKKVAKVLQQKEIKTILGEKVICVDERTITAYSGKKYLYDILIWATGVTGGAVLRNSEFSSDNKDFMFVNNYLQNINYPYIFGAGDCISFKDYDYVKKVGVYAVRQAPILWENVNNYILGTELIKYVPQKRFLSIISLGKKNAVLYYLGIILSGKLAWNIKDRIDRRFMKNFK